LAEQTLQQVVRASDFKKKWFGARQHDSAAAHVRRGIGVSSMCYGVGLHAGGQHYEGSGALAQVHADGSVSITIGGAEIGQGAFTVVAQIAADSLGVDYARVVVNQSDTALVPDSGPTVASRTTLMSGNAARDAALQLKKRLLAYAAEKRGLKPAQLDLVDDHLLDKKSAAQLATFDELALECFSAKVHLAASGWYAPPRKKWDRAAGQGQAYTTYAYGAMVAQVAVDTLTGKVTLEKLWAVHDVGRAIHREGLLAQCEGGIVQGMGWALMEELVLKEGRVLNPNFSDYLIPTVQDIPAIDIRLIEKPYKDGPFGAKGIGEPSLIPVGAAIANAVAQALGKPVNELPLSPERVKLTLLA
jgi:CO/xanthine dehydrogenase Mo-binding subunit